MVANEQGSECPCSRWTGGSVHSAVIHFVVGTFLFLFLSSFLSTTSSVSGSRRHAVVRVECLKKKIGNMNGSFSAFVFI